MKSIALPLLSVLALSTSYAGEAKQNAIQYKKIEIVPQHLAQISQKQITIGTLIKDWSLVEYQKQKYGTVEKIVSEVDGETKIYSQLHGRCEFKMTEDRKNILLSLKATPSEDTGKLETFNPLEMTLLIPKNQVLVKETESVRGDNGGYLVDEVRFVTTLKNNKKVLSPVVLHISIAEAIVSINLISNDFSMLGCSFVESGNYNKNASE